MQVVTISAQYGTGGSHIGPAVAQALGVPFVDRAIPVRVAAELDVGVDEAVAHDDTSRVGWMSGWLSGAAQLATIGFTAPAGGAGTEALLPDTAFVAHTEHVLTEVATTTGGVVLGRAAAIVLAERPGVLHVRLHGPQQRRLRQAMARRGIDEATARQEMADTDRARETYVKRFYRHDAEDPWLYHLICDSTIVSLPAVIELITTAARAVDEPA
ncbi:MAG: AAA family ATPase [Sciscionella sp.]